MVELDPRTATFARVDSGRLGARHGAALEAIAIASPGSAGARGSLTAFTPELGVNIRGVELGLRYRFVWTRDVMFPAERFNVSLDWQL